MKLNDTHRTLLQTLMHNGIMSEYELQQIAEIIFNSNNNASFYIGFLNQRLEPLGMMIKSARREFTGEKYYMVISTKVDHVTKFQTEFSQAQLEMLRNVFREIIHSPDGNVPSMFCLNMCNSLEHELTKGATEELLVDMVNRKWLDVKDGRYYMGIRSIIELMPYFRITFEDSFSNCSICKYTVFHGRQCDQCEVVCHLYCLAAFTKIQNPVKCLNCGSAVSTHDLPDIPDQAMNLDESAEPNMEHSHKRKKY